MKTNLLKATCLLIVLEVASFSSWADLNIPDESDATGAKIIQTAQFKEFIDQYITAVNAKDRKALRALYDPVSQTAMAKDEKDVAETLNEAMDGEIPAQHEIVVSMIDPKEPLPFENMGAVYAVKPVALAQINYSTRPNDSTGISLFIAPSGGKWCEVWTKPPDEKKMEEAAAKAETDVSGPDKVQTSSITDYVNEPNPNDIQKVYNWVVALDAADSKNAPYEIVQITKPLAKPSETTTNVLIHPEMIVPNDKGIIDFNLHVGSKVPERDTNAPGGIGEPISFSGKGTGTGESGEIDLPGSKIDRVIPSEKGAPLTDGKLPLIQYLLTNDAGDKFETDVVLCHPPAGAKPKETEAPTAPKPAAAGGKKPSFISWNEHECSNPLMLPDGFLVSQYDRGKYRIDGGMSEGHFNNIYIIFQASGSLDPGTVPNARQMPLVIKGNRMNWRVFKTVVEGRPVIRKEVIMPNFLPRQKQGNDADYIWVRIDGDTQDIINQLTPVAGGILRDAD